MENCSSEDQADERLSPDNGQSAESTSPAEPDHRPASTASSALASGDESSPEMTQQHAEDAKQAGTADQLVSYEAPPKPVGGSIYVFGAEVAKSVLRCDQYSWLNDGVKNAPKQAPLLKKSYYCVRDSEGKKNRAFRKHEYHLLDAAERGYTLVHYLGDSSVVTSNAPHGNSKTSHRPFHRSSSSVRKAVATHGTDTAPMKIYRKLVATPGGSPAVEAVTKPRNLEQVRNFQKAAKRKFRIGHDGLYNCIELANQFPDYVRGIQVHPDLVIHVADSSLIKELGDVIDPAGQVDASYLELQYDTTFTLGDFYVSILSFRHPVFVGRPTIPVAFMVHERKFQKDHQRFMELIKELVPALGKIKFCMVTDCEFDFRHVFPEVVHLHCWNHIKKDVRSWLRTNRASPDDLPVYTDQLVKLLKCESEDEFRAKLASLSPDWSQDFLLYFQTSISPRITNFSGRWVAEPTGLYNSYSGITTNASESMNGVLHELSAWKQRPIDGLLISLKYLQRYYSQEITRGLNGLGTHVVKDSMQHVLQPAELLPARDRIVTPDELVAFVKSGITQELNENSEEGSKEGSARSAQMALAKECTAAKKVVFVQEAKAFIVTGSGGNKYAVTLFPKETCQCASTTTCYHILAAKLSMGMPVPAESRMLNLSLLCKKRLRRSDKTSGRKKPRVQDYDVRSAPDSAATSATSDDVVDAVRESQCQQQVFEPPDADWQHRVACKLGLDVVMGHQYKGTKVPLATPKKWVRIGADGNCFYRAISYCISGTEEFHVEVRAALASLMEQDYLKKRLQDFTSTADYPKESGVGKLGTWATQTELLLMASLLNTPIFSYVPEASDPKSGRWKWSMYSPAIFGNPPDQDSKAIFLRNTNGDHFDVVVMVGV